MVIFAFFNFFKIQKKNIFFKDIQKWDMDLKRLNAKIHFALSKNLIMLLIVIILLFTMVTEVLVFNFLIYKLFKITFKEYSFK